MAGKSARFEAAKAKAAREKAIQDAEALGEDTRQLTDKQQAAARARRYRARQRGDGSPAVAKRSPGRVSREGQLRAALIEANGQIAALEKKVIDLEAEVERLKQRRRR
jgi:hypothetical protein